MSETPTFPNAQALDEAVRAVTNLAAFYEGLQTLKPALETYAAAAKASEILQRQQADAMETLHDTQAQMTRVRGQLATLEGEYAEKYQVADEAHTAYLDSVAHEQQTQRQALEALKQEYQQMVNALAQQQETAQAQVRTAAEVTRRETQQALDMLMAEREALQAQIQRLTTERAAIERELAGARARLGIGV